MTGARYGSCARWATVALAVLAVSMLAGCTSGRSELGTGSSECYLAIPRAVTAVQGRGHLAGLRLQSVASLKTSGPLYGPARSAGVSDVCLVAFSGHFSASEVRRPTGQPTGRLAVVELSYPGRHLLATLVARHLPLVFGHTHIGLL